MKLILKPIYYKKSCHINTNKSFVKSFDEQTAYNSCCFKIGINLYTIDEEYEEKDIAATIEGQFFKYNFIDRYNIDIIDLADTVSNDTYKAIETLADNLLFTEVDMEYMPLVCYIRRLYVYPKYRNKGIATYIYENLQEMFEYVTCDLTSIFIILPSPQEPITSERWEGTGDDAMFEKMVRLLNKHGFKPIGKGFYYKSYT